MASLSAQNRFLTDDYAVRIDGTFTQVKARTVQKSEGGGSLLEAALQQREFAFANVPGTIVGFWTPPYAKAIGVPGWHLHFLNQGRTAGGHLLACAGGPIEGRLEALDTFKVAIPETPAFLRADLAGDPGADLDKAEKER